MENIFALFTQSERREFVLLRHLELEGTKKCSLCRGTDKEHIVKKIPQVGIKTAVKPFGSVKKNVVALCSEASALLNVTATRVNGFLEKVVFSILRFFS